MFVSDEDPFTFFLAIIEIGLRKLKSNGKIYFEINEKFGNEIRNIIRDKGFINVDLKKDIRGKDRMISAQLR